MNSVNTTLFFLSIFVVFRLADFAISCTNNEFRCEYDPVCIPRNATCNGVIDCPDYSDETANLCENKKCLPNEFTCTYGGCIPMSAVCNGAIDCFDMSDERNCKPIPVTKNCTLGTVACRSGDQCIRLDQKCDGQKDCRDNSDEIYQTCSGIRCAPESFQCKYGACIEQDLVCNKNPDCVDASDENLPRCKSSFPIEKLQNCMSNEFQCNSGICIDKEKICDGFLDCNDGSDETVKLCNKKDMQCDYGSHFQCSYGACVPRTKLTCNSCADGSYIGFDCDLGIDKLAPITTTFNYSMNGGSGSGSAFSGSPSGFPIDFSIPPSAFEKPLTPRCYYPFPPSNGNFVSSVVGMDVSSKDWAEEWEVLKYTCNEGYSLIGARVVVCTGSEWSAPFPECLAKCPPLSSSRHEIECSFMKKDIPCNQTVEGSVASIRCKDSFEIENAILQPYNIMRCRNGSWDNTLFDCKPECGTLIPKGQALVIKGFTAAKYDFPWHAGLYEWKENGFEQICGGTLITERIILTAAHCFWDWFHNKPKTNAEKFAVAVGKFYRSWNTTKDRHAQKFAVDQISLPKKFRADESSFANDIALILLNDTIKFTALVRPICTDWSNTLHKYFLKPGSVGSVAGWGLTEEYGDAAEELQAINMPFIDYNRCVDEVPSSFRPFVTSDKICGGLRNGTSLCVGDSGGGYVFRKSNRFFIEGVVSVAPAKGPTCDSHQYAAFTRIEEHLQWMINVQRDIES